jgi:hypothetical protein
MFFFVVELRTDLILADVRKEYIFAIRLLCMSKNVYNGTPIKEKLKLDS